MDRSRINIRGSSRLPIYLTIGVFSSLLFLSIVNPVLTYMFGNLLSVGFAVGITSFSLLMRVLTKNNTLDILGAGMFVIAIFLSATIIAVISPSLIFISTPNLADQLWSMTLFFEALTLLLTALNKRTHAKISLSWTVFPLAGLCALMIVYYDIPLSNLFFNNHVTRLGSYVVGISIVLFCLAIYFAQKRKQKTTIWWTSAITTAAVFFLLSIFSAFFLHFNTHVRTVSTIFNFASFYVLFFSVLNNIVFDPLSSVFLDISVEKNRYARWDGLSQCLLDFNEKIAFVYTIAELQAQASETLADSFDSEFIAFFQISPQKDIRYLTSPLLKDNRSVALGDMERCESKVKELISATEHEHFVVRSFSIMFLGEVYRFIVCPLIIGNENEGYLISGKHSALMQEDTQMRERFFSQFCAMIALNLKSMRLENERVLQEKRELANTNRIAQTLQEAIMPLKNPTIENTRILIAPHLHAAPGLAKIGGDFYDVFCIDDNLVGFSIGDISGHGVDAAAYNAMIRSSIRALGLQKFDPAHVVSATNQHIFSELKGSLFATAVFGTLDTETGHLVMCIAGHPLPLIVYKGNKRSYQHIQNPMLGFIEGFSYRSFEVNLMPNDSIVLYTDGLTEARNSDGEEFGLHRLSEILTTKRGATPQESARILFEEVDEFCGAKEPHDDRAILIVRWCK